MADTALRTSFQTIAGIRARLAVIGEGEPVLMAHGWGARMELLQPLALKLAPLGYRCLLMDLPGFGESAEPSSAFAVRDYVGFCLALLDAQKLKAAHFFGHSLGGRIGLMLAADNPERVRGMALSNSAGIKVEASAWQKARLSIYRGARKSLGSLGAEAAKRRLQDAYSQRYGSPDYQQASPVMRQTLVKIVNQDLLDYARRVAAPTVLIWGDADDETPLWMGQTLQREMPDAALITSAGAGHYAYLDFPDTTARIMDALYRSA